MCCHRLVAGRCVDTDFDVTEPQEVTPLPALNDIDVPVSMVNDNDGIANLPASPSLLLTYVKQKTLDVSIMWTFDIVQLCLFHVARSDMHSILACMALPCH